MADGIVRGNLKKSDISVFIDAAVSCIGKIPTGTLKGTIIRGLLKKEVIIFSSRKATLVKTVRRPLFKHVETHFRDVTVRNITTGRVIRNCKAFLTATQIAPNVFFAIITINCPGFRNFRVFGFFRGRVTVIREALCGAVNP